MTAPAWQAEVDCAAAAEKPIERAVMQEVVPGRVCHVDGDYLAYFAACTDDTPVGTARHIAKNKIDTFRDMSGSEKSFVHLTASGSSKGDRFHIATVKPYQGQRAGRHPKNWSALREYLESADYANFDRKLYGDREADDGMALASAAPIDPLTTCVIATKDKDMRMLPGIHIDWSDYTLTQVPKGAYEVIGPYNGLVYGHKWFWLQTLQGDTADHIPGLENYNGKQLGEVTAAQMLAGTTCNGEAFEIVSSAYLRTYGPTWADRLVEQAALLWLRRTTHAPLNDLLHVVPACAEVREALGRLQQRVKEKRETLNKFYAQAAAHEDAAGAA